VVVVVWVQTTLVIFHQIFASPSLSLFLGCCLGIGGGIGGGGIGGGGGGGGDR